MYRHLLVPIDATDLSIEVVSDAVGLARSLGARITFFHAAKDPSVSLFNDAEVVRAVSPEKYAYAYTGKARELLAKAEAAARAFSVPCDSIQRTSDKAADAIVEAAHETSCDLIFMASHGRRSKLGMALASETLSVLMNAGLPVLVAATGDPRPPAHAIGVIRDEHRSLAAVLHAWMHELAASRTAMKVPDARLVRAMLLYIERFPMAQHHPKEEQYLFARLRQRTTSVNAELDELERQHVHDRELVSGLGIEVDSVYATSDASAQRAALVRLEGAVIALRRLHVGPPRSRGRRDPPGGAALSHRERLGGHRCGIRREPRSGLLRRDGAGFPDALLAHRESRGSDAARLTRQVDGGAEEPGRCASRRWRSPSRACRRQA